MTLTPQQVAEKKFTSTRMKHGYDETEVDAFLDEVEAELTRLHDEAESLRRQLDSAQLAQAVQPAEQPAVADVAAPAVSTPAEITPTQSEMEEMLRRTLILAQRTADEVVAEAKAEAERELSTAQAQAEALRVASEQRAAESERAASMRATASIAEFEASKRRLEEQIAALHTFESDFRGRLRAYLELQLNDLDEAKLVPAGEPLPAAAPAGTAEGVEATPARPEPTPVVLPDLPPLPSWMSADAGFTVDDDAGAAPPPPESA